MSVMSEALTAERPLAFLNVSIQYY